MLKKLLFCIVALASLHGFAQSSVAGKSYEMEMEQEWLSCFTLLPATSKMWFWV